MRARELTSVDLSKTFSYASFAVRAYWSRSIMDLFYAIHSCVVANRTSFYTSAGFSLQIALNKLAKIRPGNITAAGPVVGFVQTPHDVCQVVAFTARRAEFSVTNVFPGLLSSVSLI